MKYSRKQLVLTYIDLTTFKAQESLYVLITDSREKQDDSHSKVPELDYNQI